jgi:capsid assembly protease
MRAFDRATQTPWLITEPALREILRISLREDLDVEAVAAKLGRPLDNTHTVTVRDGVATIPIAGPIFRYANLFTLISGAASTETLARDITAALENPNVHALILHIDSPGGEATGISDLANLIHAGAADKPITAFVEGLGASAAYWLAAACTEVVASSTGMLGSIGAVLTVANPEARGPSRAIEIVSSQSPRKRPNVATERGRQQLQDLADGLAAVFVSDVARFRGVDEATVLADFGQGGLLIGQGAIDAGLADRLSTLEQLQAELADAAFPTARPRAASVLAAIPHTYEGVLMPTLTAEEQALLQRLLTTATPASPEAAPAEPTTPEAEEEVPAPDAREEAQVEAEAQTEPTTPEAEEEVPAPDAREEAAPATADPLAVQVAVTDLPDVQAALAAKDAEIAALQARAATLASENAALAVQAQQERFAQLVAGDAAQGLAPWPGARDAHLTVLAALAANGGEEGPAFTAYVTQQRALAARLAATGEPLTEALGTDAEGAPSDATSLWASVESRAAALRQQQPELSKEQAIVAVLDADRALARQVRAATSTPAYDE